MERPVVFRSCSRLPVTWPNARHLPSLWLGQVDSRRNAQPTPRAATDPPWARDVWRTRETEERKQNGPRKERTGSRAGAQPGGKTRNRAPKPQPEKRPSPKGEKRRKHTERARRKQTERARRQPEAKTPDMGSGPTKPAGRRAARPTRTTAGNARSTDDARAAGRGGPTGRPRLCEGAPAPLT